MGDMRMYALGILLFTVICIALCHSQLVGHMELRQNVKGFPIIGHLSFFDDRSQGGNFTAKIKWPNNTALTPGYYFSYVHNRNDFASGCNSTGEFPVYHTKTGIPHLRPVVVMRVLASGNETPIIDVNDEVTLAAGENSIMNKVIVFHNVSVVGLFQKGMHQLQPGLHQTSVFCGFLYPNCIPRDEL